MKAPTVEICTHLWAAQIVDTGHVVRKVEWYLQKQFVTLHLYAYIFQTAFLQQLMFKKTQQITKPFKDDIRKLADLKQHFPPLPDWTQRLVSAEDQLRGTAHCT